MPYCCVLCQYRPGPQEVIAAQSLTEDWQRGYVISTQDDTFHVAMVDIGETEKMVKNVQKLPTQFQDIPTLGVKASVTKFITEEILFSSKYLKVRNLFGTYLGTYP